LEDIMLSIGDKAIRVLRLLLGLRNQRVASAMALYGMREEDVDEGWKLLQALRGVRLGIRPIGAADVKTIEEIDAWENRWFPVADATLSRRFPAVQARLFMNLSQTEGPEVVVSVGTFVDRVDEMAKADGPYGPEGPKALELLATRGITKGVIEQARTLLGTLRKVQPPAPAPSREEQQAEAARAEDALWAWYLEWSRIARTAITNRTLLRQLGFLADHGAAAPGDEPPPPAGPGPIAPSGTTAHE
jgi:hypothetical protein